MLKEEAKDKSVRERGSGRKSNRVKERERERESLGRMGSGEKKRDALSYRMQKTGNSQPMQHLPALFVFDNNGDKSSRKTADIIKVLEGAILNNEYIITVHVMIDAGAQPIRGFRDQSRSRNFIT